MVRKLVFILIPLLLISCASKTTPAVSAEPELRPFLSLPEEEPNPKVVIDLTQQDSVAITVSYSADQWAFINAVVLRNGAGEEKRYTFKKTSHTVMSDASIIETCVYISRNSDIENYADKLREFLAVGDVTARPLADNKYFEFAPVQIKN